MASQKKTKYKPRSKSPKKAEQSREAAVKGKESNFTEAQTGGKVSAQKDGAIDRLDQNFRSLRDEVSELHAEIASSKETLARVLAQTTGKTDRKGKGGPVNSAFEKIKGLLGGFFKKSP